MAGVFVFSEDGALTQQLLTPALELKKALGQQVVAVAADESTANTLATLGADLVVLLKTDHATPEALVPDTRGLLHARECFGGAGRRYAARQARGSASRG